ncbi:MAG: PKD domain-containing protein [Bacteroidota bacterium]
MKKITIKLAICFAIMLPLCSVAQYDLQYLPCSTCPAYVSPVNFKINSSTVDLTSDYGKRQGTFNSSWHRGVDLVPAAYPDHLGFHIISPFNATIAQIYKLGDYVAVVLDGPGANDLGFGHIFSGMSAWPNPIVLGDMVLLNVPNGIGSSIVILDKTMGKAWCTVSGIYFTYGNVSYVTTNQILAGERLAPMGDSDATNVHVHLYRHVNPAGGVQDAANCKDPLKILNHMPSNLTIGLGQAYHLTTQYNNVFYAGDQCSSLKFACQMVGNALMPENTLSSYQHMMMAIDHVGFFIGPEGANESSAGWGSSNSQFKVLLGPHYQGIISQGSLPNTSIYPVDLSSGLNGNVTTTGIMPYSYSGGTYDDYFFSDFYQRLHMNCMPGSGVLQFAQCNLEAMYPDGKFRIHARAETIEGTNFGTTNQQSQVILIDNFLPFVQKVKVRKTNNVNPFYKAEWLWNGNSLGLSVQSNVACGGTDLEVTVRTSEPMAWLSMAYDSYNSGQNTQGIPGSNNVEWIFTIPGFYLHQGVEVLRFEGRDLAGNSLQILNAQGPVAASEMPFRTGSNTWSAPVNMGPDKVHKIAIGDLTPPVADFNPHDISVNPGSFVSFTDASIGDITDWNWYVSGLLNPASNLQNPVFYFSSPGDYPVSLTVSNGLGTSSASGIVHVVEGAVFPVCNFSPQNITVAEGSTVYFNDLSSGVPTQWQWDFGGVAPVSGDPFPDVTYMNSGFFPVNLSVSNAMGSSNCASVVHVVPQLPPLVVQCHADPFIGTVGLLCNFSVDIVFGTPPYMLSFNFGDGTIIPGNSSGGMSSVSHQYSQSGIFSLVVGITDANGLYEICYEGVTVIAGDPCETLQLKLKADGSESQSALDVSTPHVFSADASGGEAPYYFAWTLYPDPISGALPSMTNSSQQGPHTIVFLTTGSYKVKLMVNDHNGCTRTIFRTYTVFQPEHCMYANIQKKHGGELLVPLGQNCFYDFSQVLGSVNCQDPPGTMNVPCITSSYWSLSTYPGGLPLANKSCHPYTDPECTMGYVGERIFTHDFVQSGSYSLKLKIWDDNCQVQTGFDCKDETEVLVRVVDCGNTVFVNPEVPPPMPGYNPDVFGGTLISGNNSDFLLGTGEVMNWYATKEIILKDWTWLAEGCGFNGSIIPCPETFCGKMELITNLKDDNPKVSVFPNPGKGVFEVKVVAGTEALQQIDIYSMIGEKIKTEVCDHLMFAQFNISDEAPGVYFLKIRFEKAVSTLKITKY